MEQFHANKNIVKINKYEILPENGLPVLFDPEKIHRWSREFLLLDHLYTILW